MALQIEYQGHKNAYHRIYAMDIDEDKMVATFRVKSYPNKTARTKGNFDIREARTEIRLTKKDFIDIVLPDAEIAANKSKECKADQEKEIGAIEKAIEEHKKNTKEKIPPLSETDKNKVRTTVLNRHIAMKQKELAENAIGDLIKRFGGSENIKAVAYETMKRLPQYSEAKDV